MFRVIARGLLLLLVAGCVGIPSPDARRAHADALASAHGWHAERVFAGAFELTTYVPQRAPNGDLLTIYIEGDGHAWTASDTPSSDPTPRDPLALKLALAHPDGNAAYIARPCQFSNAGRPPCSQRYWTNARFAEDVVDATNAAVEELRRRFGAERIALVGYSGGGAVAALMATKRADIVRLVTIAGNLDHRAWTRYHRVSALDASDNPADHAERLGAIQQLHFLGGKDAVIPPELAHAWPRGLSGDNGSNFRIIADFDHACCWAEHWSQLIFMH